jgi:hypothetical protein
MPRIPDIQPPLPQSPVPIVDPADFIALRAVVLALTGVMAIQNENFRGLPAQNYINNIADICADSIRNAKIEGPEPERIRSEALKAVNHVLGGVRFPKDGRAN